MRPRGGFSAARRRAAASLVALAALGLAGPAAAHTPYRQWQVYRRKHLLIGAHRDAPATYALARRVVATLEEHLPDARARVARGPTAGRLASLLGTGQLDVAVLERASAPAMAAGEGAFAPYGPIELGVLAGVSDEHVLVARADFPDRHAWLVAEALEGTFEVPGPVGGASAGVERGAGGLGWHPGAEAWRRGEAVPAAR